MGATYNSVKSNMIMTKKKDKDNQVSEELAINIKDELYLKLVFWWKALEFQYVSCLRSCSDKAIIVVSI